MVLKKCSYKHLTEFNLSGFLKRFIYFSGGREQRERETAESTLSVEPYKRLDPMTLRSLSALKPRAGCLTHCATHTLLSFGIFFLLYAN